MGYVNISTLGEASGSATADCTVTIVAGTNRLLVACGSQEAASATERNIIAVTLDPGGGDEAAFSRLEPAGADLVISED